MRNIDAGSGTAFKTWPWMVVSPKFEATLGTTSPVKFTMLKMLAPFAMDAGLQFTVTVS
ncbi:MAG: hypothetical protein JWO80_4207, partial [Bryobacterales bacterium]|nr:hypothetical protein [Bryobacterales bacterium]